MIQRAWITLAAMSVVFFLITATTFSSLGVVLPAMIGELHWNWGGAGSGFSLLGVAAGITATIPASLIRRFGVRTTLVAGSLVMAAAFGCLALTHGLPLYFLACLLMGLGFTLLATVPGTYLLARLFARPSFAFGLYFTVGGLGRRGGTGALSLGRRHHPKLARLLAGVAADRDGGGTAERDPGGCQNRCARRRRTRIPALPASNGRSKRRLRTPQFAILAAAYSIFPVCGHHRERGVGGASDAAMASPPRWQAA